MRFTTYLKIQFPKLTKERPQLLEVADLMDKFWNNGKTGDVLNISMPTRFGKSLLSTAFSSYLIASEPTTRVLRASYAADLAESFSFQVRMQLEQFAEKLGITLKTEGTKNRWRVSGNSEDNHAGVGINGGITGFGFDLAIVDDTAKNMLEAMSAAYKRQLTSFLESVLLGRMEGRRKIINVGTRWTVNDWFSLFPNAQSYVLPAMNESGLSCCEAWKTTAEIEHERKQVSDEVWNAQYQQRPTATGRVLLFEDFAPIVATADDGGVDFIVCDPSTNYGVDFFTAFHYRHINGFLYLVDAFAKQRATIEEVAEWIKSQSYSVCWVEANGVGAEIIRQLRAAGVTGVASFSTNKDKYTRAYVQSEKIKNYFRLCPSVDAAIVQELINEARVFPTAADGAHDDLIDNVVMAFERCKV